MDTLKIYIHPFKTEVLKSFYSYLISVENSLIEVIRKTIVAKSLALRTEDNEKDGGWYRYGDEVINDINEVAARRAMVVFIPPKLKATIQFGYEDSMKSALKDEEFDSWITSTFVHTQAHFRHVKSLGTEIEFEVCKCGTLNIYSIKQL